MITTEVKQKPQQPDYPCLMIAKDGDIVLMDCYECGSVLKSKTYRVGEYRTTWVMAAFSKFDGILTLRNEP